jgi:hypothetical protein
VLLALIVNIEATKPRAVLSALIEPTD